MNEKTKFNRVVGTILLIIGLLWFARALGDLASGDNLASSSNIVWTLLFLGLYVAMILVGFRMLKRPSIEEPQSGIITPTIEQQSVAVATQPRNTRPIKILYIANIGFAISMAIVSALSDSDGTGTSYLILVMTLIFFTIPVFIVLGIIHYILLNKG